MTVEIRRNPDDSIDEIVAHGCDLHIEQMSADGWFMEIMADDTSYRFWFGAKNRKSHVCIWQEKFIPGDSCPVQGIPPELRRRHWPGNEIDGEE